MGSGGGGIVVGLSLLLLPFRFAAASAAATAWLLLKSHIVTANPRGDYSRLMFRPSVLSAVLTAGRF